MIRLRYTTVASVQFTHPFYKNGISNDFVLIPTEATRALLQTYDWVARPLGASLTLMGREDQPGQPTTPLDDTIRLTFAVQLTNALLPNVSDWGGASAPFYFSNLNPADGTAKTSLTIGATLSKSDQLPAVSGRQFSLTLEKGIYKSLTLSQVLPGVGPKVVQTVPVLPDQETLDIRVIRPGWYTLAKQPADGSVAVVSELYLHDELVMGPPFFGILELVLTQTPPAPIAYTVAMQVRKKNWRYVLIDSKVKQVEFHTDGNGKPDLKLLYLPPTDADPVFPAALSGDSSFDTRSSLLTAETALASSSIDPTHTPAQRQADLDTLRQVRSDLGLIQTMLADSRVNAVYLAQLPDLLPIVNYTSPILKLQYTGGIQFLPVPTAETPNATIFYTI